VLRFVFWAMNIFLSTTLFAEVDYEIRRLPNSLGKQFVDANGNKSLIIPTFVSNNGIIGGMQLTWSFDQKYSDGATALVKQSGYLYDLKTRTFIAQFIGGFPVTQVTDEHYISKRLHPNGQRWQTWRCPIDGIVPRSGNPSISDNPSCVLLDNDYLDQTPNGGSGVIFDKDEYWASWFIGINVVYSNFVVLPNNTAAVNNLGSTYVYDWADEVGSVPDSSQDTAGRYYSVNGFTETMRGMQKKAFDAINDDDLLKSSNYSGTYAGAVNGKDSAWFFKTFEPVERIDGTYVAEVDQPVKVHQVIFDSDGYASATSILINEINHETGHYLRPLAVSKNGLILTDRGICSFSSNCTDINYFSDIYFMDEGTSYSGDLVFENGNILLADDDESFYLLEVNGQESRIFYFEESAQQKFGETLREETDFEYPYGPGFSRTLTRTFRWSENGEYGFVFGQLEDGRPRVYSYQQAVNVNKLLILP
jgi:hypothetical protein